MLKSLIIFPTLLTTGGVSTLGVLNNYRNSPITINTSKTLDLEISTKNISELSSITKLKEDNKIVDLTVEKINNFVASSTTLDTNFSSQIYANYFAEKSDVAVSTGSIKLKSPILGDLYKTQIDLSNEKQIYTEVKTHFVSNTPSTTNLEIAKDTSVSSSPTVCKIQTKSSSATVSPSTDPCSYGWNIMFISVEDKITQILAATPPTSPSDLTSKYTTLTSSKNKAP